MISAFPNALLNEKFYIIQLKGFNDNTNRVCLLIKALYKLKQASKAFHICLLGILNELKF